MNRYTSLRAGLGDIMRALGRLQAWFLLWLLLSCNFLFSQAPPVRRLVTSAVRESQLTTLRSNTHPLARAEFEVGAALPNLRMERMLLVLKRSPEQEHSLAGLLDQLQDKASPHFHQWLTPEQFGQEFGPAASDIQAVTTWLESHGFQVAGVSKGRTVIEFSGTAAQVQSAFHTSIHKYVVNGDEHWANASDPQIPSALTPVVAGIATLHNFFKQPLLRMAAEPVPFTRAPFAIPASTFPGNDHALSPGDYATIYNINPLYQAGIDGTGSSIAVVARTEIDPGDVSDFLGIFGIGYNLSFVFNGPSPGNLRGGEEAEAILDSTWSSSIAPGASVHMVISASTDTTDGVDLSELYIIDHNLADVMTESFGSCEAFYTQADADFTSNMGKQAAAQGITYLVSSGDSGASGCDRPSSTSASGPLSVNLLASTPYNIAVGGTMFNEHGQDATYWNPALGTFAATAKSYIPENVWNESCTPTQCGSQNAGLWAGGGGVSQFFAKPSWQAGVAGIPKDGKRDLPDVSLTAAGHDPYLICYERSCLSGQMYGVSGTSASAPSFAGIMALINQKTGSRQGQANYVLYRLAAKETFSQCNGSKTTGALAASCVFNDTTVGNIAVPGQSGFGTSTGKYQATVGYDLATGLGSVNVNNLAKQWSSVTFNSTSTTLTLSPLTIAHGTPVTVNVSVTPNGGTGTPTGSAVLQGLAATTNIDQFNLSAGSVAASTNLLPGGTYDVIAHYSGDGTFGSSNSAAVNVTVTPEPSITTLSVLTADANNNPTPFIGGPYGSFIYPRADVAGQSGHGTPTGSVSFTDASLSLDTFNLNSEGNAAPPNGYTWLAPGSHMLLATYGGDSSFDGSASSTVNFDITLAPTSTVLTVDKTSVGNGSTVTLSARINTNSFATNGPGGSITFLSGSTAIGTASLFSNTDPRTGKAFSATSTFETNTLPVGDNAIIASYAGDTYYEASTSPVVTVSVQHEFAVAVDKNIITLKPGQIGTVSFTVTGEPGYNGTINFAASSCTGLPNETSCSFSPASITGSGKTTVTISTTAPSSLLRPAGRTIFYALWTGASSLFAGIFMLPVVNKRRRNTLLTMLILAFVVGGTSCGGGGGSHDPGTNLGNYTISVTAKSGTLSHAATFNLVVQ